MRNAKFGGQSHRVHRTAPAERHKGEVARIVPSVDRDQL